MNHPGRGTEEDWVISPVGANIWSEREETGEGVAQGVHPGFYHETSDERAGKRDRGMSHMSQSDGLKRKSRV
jgi:hypothetical protein